MAEFLNAIQSGAGVQPVKVEPEANAGRNETSELGQRFEKMLWAEMLRHTGLEEAMTRAGGQGASAFAQFMVEAIAEDIAERHPLGLDPIPRGGDAVMSNAEIKEGD
ncbi:MAG: hypothetical protein RIB03_04035 [Henriciella sp.]|uniref:hypothetical protein n=1 Tax=Henriciella sp. TaxID=1968823 RepID=UPI0032EB58B6